MGGPLGLPSQSGSMLTSEIADLADPRLPVKGFADNGMPCRCRRFWERGGDPFFIHMSTLTLVSYMGKAREGWHHRKRYNS